MSEDNKIVLTLHDEETEAKAGLAQAGLNADAAALAAEEERKKAEAAAAAKTPVFVDDSVLTDEERKQVEDFAKTIDLHETNTILQYGAGAQKKISDFSDATLNNVRTKDLGEAGNLLSNLVVELKGFDTEKEKGLLGLFKKAGNSVQSMKAKYDKAEVNVEKIADALENQQIVLMKDIALLDQMYEKNLVNYKELTMYILAGQKKLKQAREVELPELMDKAKKSGLAEDAQAANDYEQLINRFEKKLYDLELTRNVALQMGPQIRLVQNNDTLMTEKIQSTLVNTIPLWKSQMVLALGINHSKEAVEAQQAVSEVTNQLLKKNAETLKQETIATAKESERGLVDIETLQQTNRALISTLEEVVKIQDEGRAKRAAAEHELAKIEGELKAKLLEINREVPDKK
ncbi:MAG: toxic anion resistance protein [Erysipelotrichales bacterium]|nr:toxic anion resistance protein [Erysipelotrichales bacterium]